MVKQVLGISFVVFLIGVVIVGLIDQQTTETSDPNNNNLDGAAIVAPGQTDVEVGEMAPNFKLETLSGETFQLSDLHGKKVILNFWASWCGPCKREMPEMQKIHEKYQDEVQIVAVNLTGSETSVKAVEQFVNKYGFTYPILLDKELKVKEKYEVGMLPTTYFIGSNGRIQESRKLGPMTHDYMVKMLNKLK